MQANCSEIISSHYPYYLSTLKDLIAIPSVFTDSVGIKQAIHYCKDSLSKNLPGWQIYFDAKHNLIARPESIQPEQPVVYLSAHIDTVDANAGEWGEPCSPFKPFENEREIRGRGSSDCKAGVAYELYLAHLYAQRHLDLGNIIFTLTFNEEGSGDKTAREIGRNLGSSLPVADSATYFFVLENNVRPLTTPVLCVYDRERGNYVIKTQGTLGSLQSWLREHAQWNPVCIYPDMAKTTWTWITKHQESRHVCSVPREENLLYQRILDATPNTVLKAGQECNFGVLPAMINTATSPCPIDHILILSNRSFDTLEEVQSQLQDLSYQEMKPFAISQGLDARQKLSRNPLTNILEECCGNDLDIERTYNIGASDASIVYNSVDPEIRKCLLPIVMGPGTRSQPHADPPRFTHGRNETFDKDSGKKAMILISDVLSRLEVISVL